MGNKIIVKITLTIIGIIIENIQTTVITKNKIIRTQTVIQILSPKEVRIKTKMIINLIKKNLKKKRKKKMN